MTCQLPYKTCHLSGYQNTLKLLTYEITQLKSVALHTLKQEISKQSLISISNQDFEYILFCFATLINVTPTPLPTAPSPPPPQKKKKKKKKKPLHQMSHWNEQRLN